MQRVFVAIVLVFLLVALAVGCSMLAEPEWSDNYAVKAQCNVPEMNDGSMYSSGKTQMPEYVKGAPADDSRFNDVVFTFPEPKLLRKVLLRRRKEDLVAIDVNIFALIDDKWKLLTDTTRGAITEDVSVNIRTTTTKLKIRTQRATRAKTKSSATAGSEGRGSSQQMERVLREPVKFAEIEIYGLKPKVETKES